MAITVNEALKLIGSQSFVYKGKGSREVLIGTKPLTGKMQKSC